MSLVGRNGKGHAHPSGGRRASAPIRPFISLANTGPFQEPVLRCLSPSVPHRLGPWSPSFRLHPRVPTEGPGLLRVPSGLGFLGPTITGFRVWDGLGLPEGFGRLSKGSQFEGEFNRPMRRKGTHGQKLVVCSRSTEAVADEEKMFSVGFLWPGSKWASFPRRPGAILRCVGQAQAPTIRLGSHSGPLP